MKPILRHKTKVRWRLFLLVASLFLSACVPTIFIYDYIHLDENTMQVIEYGKATAHIDLLYNHEDMPVRYVLKTKDYNLYASLSLKYRRSMHFIVNSLNNDKLFIIGSVLDKHPGGFSYTSTTPRKYKPPLKENELAYVFGDDNQNQLLDTSNLALTIKVFSEQGELLGEHKIPFLIKKNGKILYFHVI